MSRFVDSKVTSVNEKVSALLNYSDTFSFVIREGTNPSKEVINLLESLKIYFIEMKQVSEWPGTKLLWEQAVIYTYHLNNESAYLLYSREEHLFNWLLPRHPEDLVLYRNNRPLFVSITHESDAYFVLEADDEEYLKSKDLF